MKTHNITEISRIDGTAYQCGPAIVQYGNKTFSIWTDGDTTHEADIEISSDTLDTIKAAEALMDAMHKASQNKST